MSPAAGADLYVLAERPQCTSREESKMWMRFEYLLLCSRDGDGVRGGPRGAPPALPTGSNSTRLSRDMGRAESTRQQDDPALKVLDYYITGVLNMVPLDDLNKEQLDDCVSTLS